LKNPSFLRNSNKKAFQLDCQSAYYFPGSPKRTIFAIST